MLQDSVVTYDLCWQRGIHFGFKANEPENIFHVDWREVPKDDTPCDGCGQFHGGETLCPVGSMMYESENDIHCIHWWDCEQCCRCGDDVWQMPFETI